MLDFVARLESEVRSYVRSFPTVFSHAQGSWLTDIDGNRYLDFFAGAGTLNYGHNPHEAKQALLGYIAGNGIQHSLDMATEAKCKFLSDFERIILQPRGLNYKLQMTGPTGTNCVEAAIKLARKKTGRSHVVAFTGSYHGHTLGSLALTANRYFHHESFGSHGNVTHLPFDGYLGDFDTSQLLEKMLSDPGSGLPLPAAVILETVQGQGGINVASDRWLCRVAELCRRHEVLLIVDDIQVGNGRTGTFFSFEDAGIQPDMVCLSKAIGGGLPLAMVLLRPEIDVWKPAEHTGTFRGNNLAFVAGRAVMQHWADPRFAEHIADASRIVQHGLQEIADRNAHLSWKVRGRGMIWGLDVGSGSLANAIGRNAFQRQLILETSGADDEVVKLLPPLTSTHEELREGLGRLGSAIEATTASVPTPVVSVAMPMTSAMTSI